MIPPPPSSTLFPYTTLFRSDERHRARRARVDFQHANQVPLDGILRVHKADDLQLARHRMRVFADRLNDLFRERVRRQDRKSTRLNSSHTVISYAVFCLKKKI